MAAQVKREPVATTLKAIRSMPRPQGLDRNRLAFADQRISPLETQVWRIHAKVTEAVLRVDGDLYLVIEADGVRGCAELPDPQLCQTSPFLKEITALRRRLEQELHPGYA